MTITNTLLISGETYADLARSIFDGSQYAHWPLNERDGSVLKSTGPAGYDGAHAGVVLNAVPGPHDYGMAGYDGIDDFGNVHSAALQSLLSSNAEGTLVAFLRMRSAGVWADGVLRHALSIANGAANNWIYLRKNTTGTVRLARRVAGVELAVTGTLTQVTTTFGLALTWSVTNNRQRAYVSYPGIAPAQIGSDVAGVVAFSGVTLDANGCTIGATNTSPVDVWDGYAGDIILAGRESSAIEIARLLAL